jgi:hypothetical protein
MCDYVEYLRIDCANAHYTIERRRLQYTLRYTLLYNLWGGTGAYRNLRQHQLCGGKGDSEVQDNNNCGVVQEGINWSIVCPF